MEMSHKQFLEILADAQKHGIICFAQDGKKYVGVVDEIFIGKNGEAVITAPAMYVDTGEERLEELLENHPRYLKFDWLAATYEMVGEPALDYKHIRIHTKDREIYNLVLSAECVKLVKKHEKPEGS